jgi:ribosomal protein L10|tara:strand:- start:2533 stop:2796 length:264 start_codon:yes stop_codon:yes gene_type:complete
MEEERTIGPPQVHVGLFARAHDFVDELYAGIVYGAAVQELAEQQIKVTAALAETKSLDDPGVQELAEIDMEMELKWRLASELFGIEA